MEAKAIDVRTLSLSLLAILILEIATQLLSSASAARPMVLLGAVRILEILAIVQILRRLGKGVAEIGMPESKILDGLKRGLIWSAGFGILAAVVFAVFRGLGTDLLAYVSAPMSVEGVDLLVLLVVGGLLSPIAEEIFFRGILYGYLRRWGPPVAVILSTVLFVLVHSNRSQIPLTQMTGGIVFAIAYEIEDNLMVPITIHILGNTAIFILSLLTGARFLS